MPKINYVVPVYLGDRRVKNKKYDLDRLFFSKEQLRFLHKIKHNLTQITFVVNQTGFETLEQLDWLNSLPSKIQNAECKIYFRENIGMSYGCLSYAYEKSRKDFDYYIFCEDDYYFVIDNFDIILLDIYNECSNCGYLCCIYKNEHAAHSVGILSSKVLEQIFSKYGKLPHSSNSNYGCTEAYGQIGLSRAVLEAGYHIYDIRKKYKVPFLNFLGETIDYFEYNSDVLVLPSVLANKLFEEKI